jgi:hypothetical protein
MVELDELGGIQRAPAILPTVQIGADQTSRVPSPSIPG